MVIVAVLLAAAAFQRYCGRAERGTAGGTEARSAAAYRGGSARRRHDRIHRLGPLVAKPWVRLSAGHANHGELAAAQPEPGDALSGHDRRRGMSGGKGGGREHVTPSLLCSTLQRHAPTHTNVVAIDAHVVLVAGGVRVVHPDHDVRRVDGRAEAGVQLRVDEASGREGGESTRIAWCVVRAAWGWAHQRAARADHCDATRPRAIGPVEVTQQVAL